MNLRVINQENYGISFTRRHPYDKGGALKNTKESSERRVVATERITLRFAWDRCREIVRHSVAFHHQTNSWTIMTALTMV